MIMILLRIVFYALIFYGVVFSLGFIQDNSNMDPRNFFRLVLIASLIFFAVFYFLIKIRNIFQIRILRLPFIWRRIIFLTGRSILIGLYALILIFFHREKAPPALLAFFYSLGGIVIFSRQFNVLYYAPVLKKRIMNLIVSNYSAMMNEIKCPDDLTPGPKPSDDPITNSIQAKEINNPNKITKRNETNNPNEIANSEGQKKSSYWYEPP